MVSVSARFAMDVSFRASVVAWAGFEVERATVASVVSDGDAVDIIVGVGVGVTDGLCVGFGDGNSVGAAVKSAGAAGLAVIEIDFPFSRQKQPGVVVAFAGATA